MDLVKKTKFWRGFGKLINAPYVSSVIDPARGLINVVSAARTRQREGETPWTQFEKKLSESYISVVTTAGFHLEGQEPFDIDSAKGDPTFRALQSDFDKSQLRIADVHYPHARAKKDINVLLPIDRLRELVANNVLAGLAPNFYSFGWSGGGLTREFIEPGSGTAHLLSQRLREDGADFVLLAPA